MGNFENIWDYQTRAIRLVPSLLLYILYNWNIKEVDIDFAQVNELVDLGYYATYDYSELGQACKITLHGPDDK